MQSAASTPEIRSSFDKKHYFVPNNFIKLTKYHKQGTAEKKDKSRNYSEVQGFAVAKTDLNTPQKYSDKQRFQVDGIHTVIHST